MPTVDEMRIIMDADVARLGAKLDAGTRSMQRFERSTADSLRRIDGHFRRIGMAAGALAGGLGSNQIIQYANAWTRTSRALEASQDVFGISLRSTEELVALANDARIDVEAYGKVYIRTAAAIRDFGHDEAKAAEITSTLAKALKLGSASASEQASTILQFSQALQKGKLDGDEFRTVMENAGVVQELLAQRLGVTKGEIITLAAEGKIKLGELVGAMSDGAAKIDAIFRRMPQTIDESMTVLNNSIMQYIGHLDTASGGTENLVAVITGLANNFETVADSTLVLGAGLLAAFSPRVVSGIASAATGAAAFAGPLGIALGLLGAGTVAMQLFGDEIAVSADGMVTLNDTFQAAMLVAGERMAPVLDEAAAAWQVLVAKIQEALSGVNVSFEDIATAAKVAVNSMIGVFMFAAKSIAASFLAVPPAIGEMFVDMANNVIAIINRMVDGIATAVNALPGIEIDTHIDLGQIENPLAGAGVNARKAMADAGAQLSRDFVGEFGAGLTEIGTAIGKQAELIAQNRRWAATVTKDRDAPAARAQPGVDRDLADKMKRAADQIKDLERRALESTGRYREALAIEHARELDKFKEMLDDKLISEDDYTKARALLAATAAREMLEATEREYEQLRQATDALASNMQGAFDEFIETGKVNFKGFASSLLADLARIAFQMGVIKPLLGGQGEGFGLLGDLFTSGFGGARANGGPVRSGQTYLVGERGPELFTPQLNGGIIPNGRLGGGGGGSYSIAIDARNSTPDAVTQLQAKLPSLILNTIRDARTRGLA